MTPSHKKNSADVARRHLESRYARFTNGPEPSPQPIIRPTEQALILPASRDALAPRALTELVAQASNASATQPKSEIGRIRPSPSGRYYKRDSRHGSENRIPRQVPDSLANTDREVRGKSISARG